MKGFGFKETGVGLETTTEGKTSRWVLRVTG